MFEAAIAQPSILSDFAQNCISAVGTWHWNVGRPQSFGRSAAAPLHQKFVPSAVFSGTHISVSPSDLVFGWSFDTFPTVRSPATASTRPNVEQMANSSEESAGVEEASGGSFKVRLVLWFSWAHCLV